MARGEFLNAHCKFISGYFIATFGKIGLRTFLGTFNSTRKLWLKILPPQGKNSFLTFSYQVTEIVYCSKTAIYIQFGVQLCRKYTSYGKKGSNKSCSKLNFVYKSPPAHLSISPHSGAMVLERLMCVEIFYFSKKGKCIQFGVQLCRKYASYEKKV